MLLHLTPKAVAAQEVQLIDVSFPEFDLVLREGTDLKARRPYPNKTWLVASSARERAAKDGILLETQERVSQFTMVTRWAVAAEMVVTQEIAYRILDETHDAASADPCLWYSFTGWPKRWPDCIPYEAPVRITPTLVLDGSKSIEAKTAHTFPMPTLERERILQHAGMHIPNRAPKQEAAFAVPQVARPAGARTGM
ncbi:MULTISPECIES: DUF6012 family protein [unclassified Xanthobacter]|uniref:DUF6012 family protein n=1 Tax=unclassified Xanthobacter TaxID=2623496 RepID=UPI001F21B3C4|nr:MULTISPECIES: DUF6012 family protein [unclassified Xanthobacter]